MNNDNVTTTDVSASAFTPEPDSLIAQAFKFATQAHANQRRKFSGLPYVSHCVDVARIASLSNMYEQERITPQQGEDMICAALLHDTIEDTDTTREQIEEQFGSEVATLVLWLTSTEKGDRAERKEKERYRLTQAPAIAQTLKLADIIANLKDWQQCDDLVWLTQYMEEKRLLLGKFCLGAKGDLGLLSAARKIVNAYDSKMGQYYNWKTETLTVNSNVKIH